MGTHSDPELNIICLACMNIIKDKKINILKNPFLVNKFYYLTSLRIELTDALPKNLCEKCFDNINLAYDFKTMCIESYSKLHELINSKLMFNDVNDLGNDEENPEEFLKLHEKRKTKYHLEYAENENVDNDNNMPSLLEEDIKSNVNENNCVNQDLKERYKNNHSNDNNSKRQNVEKSQTNVYQCNQCSKRFFKKSCFDAHQREHLGLKPFACPHCEKSFTKSSGLGVHIRNIHENNENIFVCKQPGCDKFYKRKQTLQWHCRTVHEKIASLAEPNLFICEVCGASFKNVASLKKHRFKHTGEDLPFECSECGKRYLTKHKLKEHMLRHAGIKNFVCPYCGMRKTTRTELKTHINYHTKEKQYPCNYCDSIFNSSGNLGRHVRIVHEGIKDFACKHCGRTFGKAETCRHHEMIHTGEKPHSCYICNKRFIQLIALRMHIKRHTNRKNPTKSKLNSSNVECLIDLEQTGCLNRLI